MLISYIGHATLLLELGGVRILTDPNFDPHLGRFLPRVSPPGIALEALPRLDALLVTHAHFDHLSFDSLRRLPRDVPLLAPPAVATWLRRLGHVHAEPIAPGADVRIGGVTIHAERAAHVGARYGIDRWRGAANMYLLDAADASVFFAGDTGLTPDTHRLAERVLHAAGRAPDVALLPIGHPPAWKRRGFRRGHLTSEDALELFERLRARWLVPYHWGTFDHVTSTAHDAIRHLRRLLPAHHRAEAVRILAPGESFAVEPGLGSGNPGLGRGGDG